MNNLYLKYFSPFLLVLLIIFGCAPENDNETVEIGFSQGLGNHPYRTAMNHSMEIQASLHSNVNFRIFKADGLISKQIADIQKMIDSGTEIIIISPIDPVSVVPVVEKAYAKGIPVILLDRAINSDKYTTYIGADNFEIGKEAAKYIRSASQNQKYVIEIKGDDLSSPTLERSIGFKQQISTYPNIHLLETLKGFSPEVFKEKISSYSYPEIYVFAFNDELANAAWQTLHEMGINKRFKIIGVDGLNTDDGGIKMVLDGKLDATLLYPNGSSEAIETAIKIHQGKAVPKRIELGTTIIDRFNANIMRNQFDRISEQQTIIEDQVLAIKKTTQLYSSQTTLFRWAIGLLTMMLCSVAYCIYLIYRIKIKHKQLKLTNERITIQRNQIENIAEKLKESNEAKVNFFTGISHEFKTPITLIISALDSLNDVGKKNNVKIPYEFELINKNSNRLLRLIDNLLDFRKLENKTFNLRVSETNIYDFTYSIYRDFEVEARKRNIQFEITTRNTKTVVFIDRNLMDKVYFNLLSNAFKFTPDNGKIEIEIREKGNQVVISFKDNGIGILPNEIKNVFTAYFRGSNNRKNSSGIGLHLTQQFVQLHMGTIDVVSQQGTEFIITLYKGDKHFNEDQIVKEPDLLSADMMKYEFEPIFEDIPLPNNLKPDEDSRTLLLIEDNKDLTTFLYHKLSKDFAVIVSDGTDAIQLALDVIPDVIVTDVNLPDKSGFEISEILKSDLRTSHIPLIILTALGSRESYLKGLESGVDLYLTKPFSYPILLQSIRSLLFNREKLRYYYTNNINRISDGKSFGNIEQDFVSKLNKCIIDNHDNASFSVELLAEELHVSRVQLYRKVKALFNINISDYINNIKLDSAKALLQNSTLTVSEIAYKTGFSSPNYFSTVFKAKFGVSPNVFRKTQSEELK